MTEHLAHRSEAHCFRSRTPERSRALAAALGRVFRETAADAGLLVSLCGELGAGKTVFVKGLAEGLGLDPDLVSSPTFVLAHQYPSLASCTLHHVDLYRLESASELESMGFFELVRAGALVAVEWGDRFADELPGDRLEVRIQRERANVPDERALQDTGARCFEASATGPRAAHVLEAWRSAVESQAGTDGH